MKGYDSIVIAAGKDFEADIDATNKGSLDVTLPPVKDQIDRDKVVKQKLRKHFNEFPGVRFSFMDGGFDQAIPDFMYTVIPLVTGRGGDARKWGDTTWPETNIIIISYADDSVQETVEKVVNFIKKKFPTEGTKLFVMHDR